MSRRSEFDAQATVTLVGVQSIGCIGLACADAATCMPAMWAMVIAPAIPLAMHMAAVVRRRTHAKGAAGR